MMPPNVLTGPDGQPLGPNTPFTVDHLGQPGYEWATDLGVRAADLPAVIELGADKSCRAAIDLATSRYIAATVRRYALPIGRVAAYHYHRGDPDLEVALDMLAAPCACGRPEHESESEVLGLRAALIAGDDPILVIIQGCIIPGAWTPAQAEAIGVIR